MARLAEELGEWWSLRKNGLVNCDCNKPDADGSRDWLARTIRELGWSLEGCLFCPHEGSQKPGNMDPSAVVCLQHQALVPQNKEQKGMLGFRKGREEDDGRQHSSHYINPFNIYCTRSTFSGCSGCISQQKQRYDEREKCIAQKMTKYVFLSRRI